ncbi:Lrp/AsnC ligand binding domain-containing protein [Spirillospora sp. NPDC052269]
MKVRAATTEHLQDVLRRLYAIDGVSGTQATVVLETFFERPLNPGQESRQGRDAFRATPLPSRVSGSSRTEGRRRGPDPSAAR